MHPTECNVSVVVTSRSHESSFNDRRLRPGGLAAVVCVALLSASSLHAGASQAVNKTRSLAGQPTAAATEQPPTTAEQLSNHAPAGWRSKRVPAPSSSSGVAGVPGRSGPGVKPVPAEKGGGTPPAPRSGGNDLCATASPVSDGTFPFDLTGATNDYAGTCGSTGAAPDRWWVYTPSCTGTASWSTCTLTSLDTVMTVLDECGGAHILCLDDFCGLQTQVSFAVVAGEDYFLRLAGFNGAIGSGSFSISLAPSAGPSNDACAAAIVVSDGTHAFSSLCATNDYAGVCGATAAAPDVWWSYTAASNGILVWQTCGLTSLDTVLSILDTCGGTTLACLDDSCGLQTSLAFAVNAGSTYALRLAGFNGAAGSGQFVLSLLPPVPNDDCANAAPISEACWYEYDNSIASMDGQPDMLCTTSPNTQIEADLWYLWTGSCTDTIIVESCGGSSLDTMIAVYDNGLNPFPVCPTGAALACIDDSCGVQSRVQFTPTIGHTYLFRVGTFPGTPRGPGAFRVSCGECNTIGCQPGTREEAEPCAGDTNGGCNAAAPNAYELVTCDERIHGTSFALAGTRDTDWYRVIAPASGNLSITISADFPCVCFILDLGNPIPFPCGTFALLASTDVAPCATSTVTVTGLIPGAPYVVFVAPGMGGGGIFDGIPCPANYVVDFDVGSPCPCCCPDGTATTPTTYAFQIGGISASGVSAFPWTISFPGTPGCVELSGMTGLTPSSCAALSANNMAYSINAAAAEVGVAHIIQARSFAGEQDCDDAVLLIEVFGNSACTTCAMTFCVGSPACCIPPAGTCIPASLSSPTISAIPLLCSDCDGNGIDDQVDVLQGLLTDVNTNGVFDQCEGLPLPHASLSSPLGFPIAPINVASVLTLGGNNRVSFAASAPMDRGYSVGVAGFESAGFEFEAPLVGAVVGQSQVRIDGAGDLNAVPVNPRSSARIVVHNTTPSNERYRAFQEYAPAANANQIRVVLLNAAGHTVSTATLPYNPAVPLVTFGPSWPRVQLDAAIREANAGTTVRGTVLRFVGDAVANIEPAFPMFPNVREIRLIPVGPGLGTFGNLQSATLTARQLGTVTTTDMFTGIFNGAGVFPGAQAVANTSGGMGDDLCIDHPGTKGTSETKTTIDIGCVKAVEFELAPPTDLKFCAYWHPTLCYKDPDNPTVPEKPLDPLDIFHAVDSTNFSAGVDIFVPLCTATPGGIVNYRTLDNNGWTGFLPIAPSSICAQGIARDHAGTIDLWPKKLREELVTGTSGRMSCIIVTFEAPTSGPSYAYDLGSSGGSANGFIGGSSTSGTAYPTMLQIQFLGIDSNIPCSACLSSIKLPASGTSPFKITGMSVTANSTNGDFNSSGSINSQDFFDFLIAFFNNDPAADFDCSGTVNAQDFFDFLTCFFGGC